MMLFQKKKKKAESANDKTKKETFKRDPYKCQYCGELKKNHQCEAVEKVVIRDFGTQTDLDVTACDQFEMIQKMAQSKSELSSSMEVQYKS